MTRDPRRVYQTLPGGCQAEEGTVEPVCCHLTRSNHATHTHTHTHTHTLHPSQPVLPPGHGTEEEQTPSQGVWWDWGPRWAPELPACIFPSSAELSSRWPRVTAVAPAITSAFLQQNGEGKNITL